MSGAVLIHDELLDHYKFPRYRALIQNPHFTAGVFNQSCGDRVTVSGRVVNGILISCGFQGEGCVLSQAAASMLMEYVHGAEIETIKQIDATYLKERIGIEVGPTRLRCILLVLEALRAGLAQLE